MHIHHILAMLAACETTAQLAVERVGVCSDLKFRIGQYIDSSSCGSLPKASTGSWQLGLPGSIEALDGLRHKVNCVR